jgi:chromosomal replication initiator protein
LTDNPIDMNLTQTVVGRLVTLEPHSFDTKDIITAVCQHMNVAEKVITARTRQREAVRARNIVMYLIKKYTDSSLAQIGACVHRDHATVAHSLNTMADLMSYDAVLRQEVNSIERLLER